MEFLISVSVLGTTYALLAAGIVIVYKASRVVNFAHGELAIVGAYGFYSAGLLRSGRRRPAWRCSCRSRSRQRPASCSASRSTSP